MLAVPSTWCTRPGSTFLMTVEHHQQVVPTTSWSTVQSVISTMNLAPHRPGRTQWATRRRSRRQPNESGASSDRSIDGLVSSPSLRAAVFVWVDHFPSAGAPVRVRIPGNLERRQERQAAGSCRVCQYPGGVGCLESAGSSGASSEDAVLS